jgi:hypothetical protein
MAEFKKIIKQLNYVEKSLEKLTSCKIKNKNVHDIDDISIPVIKDIITKKFNNGVCMNSVICLFDNLFLKTYKYKNRGLYRISSDIKKWLKNLKKIGGNSVDGFVFFSYILSDIEVIIKVPQNLDDYTDTMREYFIGITEINKLRYTIPNFVYTFGAFVCPVKDDVLCVDDEKIRKTPFIIYEKISGENMTYMLENNLLSFDQYIGMFIQILLALEVAQRDISFCHFDFHTENLMCRTLDGIYEYKVPLDNNIYEVTCKDYLPVIIDFGRSTVKHDNMIIGSYDFKEYGMMHYMIQGADMYKFLVYSCLHSTGDMKNQIMNLFSFYGTDDPYKFLTSKNDVTKNVTSEFARGVSFSDSAMHTPNEFLDWILTNSKYSKIASQYIKKRERDVYFSLSYNTTINEYDNMFKSSKKSTDKSDQLMNICTKTNYSFILTKYSLHILKGYNEHSKSFTIIKNIKKLETLLEQSDKQMIEMDNTILNEYKNIKIPNTEELVNRCNDLLSIGIESIKIIHLPSFNRIIDSFMKLYSIFTDILPYLQIVYTIKELKLDSIYKVFLAAFLSSNQYKTYIENYRMFNKTVRWSTTIYNSIV